MKCKKCGCDTLIKKGDWYECADCGAMTFDTTVTVNDVKSPTKLVEALEGSDADDKNFSKNSGYVLNYSAADNEKTENEIKPADKQQAPVQADDTGDKSNSSRRKNKKKKESDELEERSKLRETVEFMIPIVAAVVVAIILKSVVFANAVVPTGSMLNTIQEGDRIIASRLAYINNDPQRYDIIIFKYPDNEEKIFVKRVIGLPGETVQIVNGVVYVTKADGETIMLDDSFVTEEEPEGDFGPFTVPDGAYFVMGDNRNSSHDSRFWKNKYVYEDKILGKVKFKYYPGISKIE